MDFVDREREKEKRFHTYKFQIMSVKPDKALWTESKDLSEVNAVCVVDGVGNEVHEKVKIKALNTTLINSDEQWLVKSSLIRAYEQVLEQRAFENSDKSKMLKEGEWL